MEKNPDLNTKIVAESHTSYLDHTNAHIYKKYHIDTSHNKIRWFTELDIYLTEGKSLLVIHIIYTYFLTGS